MSLDKAIEHHKEYRKPYYGSKAIDPSCRCHGGCDWCLANRLYKYRKKQLQLEQKEQEYLNGEETSKDVRQCFYRAFDLNLLSERGEN